MSTMSAAGQGRVEVRMRADEAGAQVRSRDPLALRDIWRRGPGPVSTISPASALAGGGDGDVHGLGDGGRLEGDDADALE